MGKKNSGLVALVLGLAGPLLAAQNHPPFSAVDCNTPGCEVTEVIINTGYDHNSGSTYLPVTPDGWWELVDSPNAGLVVPSPAFVIKKDPAWATMPGSQWISAYDTHDLNENNAKPKNPYSFQRCICTCQDTVLHIDFDMLVDNVADVYFDGVLIGSQTNTGLGSFQTPFHVETTMAASTGEHCLRIDVRNLSIVSMGLNVNGIIETSPAGSPIMLSPLCCQKTGKIIVQKFADSDCDGVMDSPAKPLGGWTFTLSPGGQTATTDAQGKAYFTVDPGTYTVIESPLFGWTAGSPASGAQDVDVGLGMVKIVNFLNCPNVGSITVCKYADLDCDGVKDAADNPLPGWTFGIQPVVFMGFQGGIFGSSGGVFSGSTYTATYRSKYQVVTAGDGCSTISLPLGHYTVTEIGKPGWHASNPATGDMDVTLTVAEPHKTVEFLNCQTPIGEISVCKYADVDCDGEMDAVPIPLPGWKFTLTPGNLTQTTDAQGCASFFVAPGTYTVTETPQQGWTLSAPVSGQAVVSVAAFTSYPVTFLNCPPPVAWIDLGWATSGPFGTPTLTANGTLYPNSPLSLDVTGAPPGKPVQVLFGAGSLKTIPFLCGILMVDPIILPFAPPATNADSFGNAHFDMTWPAGVPSNTSIYMQAVIIDSSHPCGGLLSNALTATTP